MSDAKRYRAIRHLWELERVKPDVVQEIIEALPSVSTHAEFDAAVDFIVNKIKANKSK